MQMVNRLVAPQDLELVLTGQPLFGGKIFERLPHFRTILLAQAALGRMAGKAIT